MLFDPSNEGFYAQMILKITVYLYFIMHYTNPTCTDLILTVFDNIRICFEILAWTGSYLKGV